MKMMKKVLALVLAFAMVVTGIYFVKEEGNEAKAATSAETGATVDDGMLNVKVQPGKNADDSIHALRFVTSVNSLDYKNVGFLIEWKEGTTPKSIDWTVPDKTVFKRIESKAEDSYMDYKFSPKVVDTSAEYFATGMLNVTGKEDILYTVTAYVITFTDKIEYGASRCVSYNDAKSASYVNMSFVSSTNVTTDITGVTSTASSTTYTAKVIGSDANPKGGYDIHVRVQGLDAKTLPSATKFTFGSYGTAIFRNLYTTHVKVAGDTTQINADTSWYDIDKNASEFVIATSADLYGLAAVSNANEKFVSDTIYLVSDVAVNQTTDGVTAKAWADAAGTKPSDVYAWTPIAGNGYYSYFGGTFDGQMHEISGLYIEKAGEVGMFGICQSGSSVKNLYLEESFVKSTGNKAGSVAGCFNGTMENIYSNAIVSNSGQFTGGIIGTLEDDKATIKNCWFDGEIFTSGNYGKYVGGILGTVYTYKTKEREYYLENNLFTGVINSNCGSASIITGGIIGGSYYWYSPKNIYVTNCLSAGKITSTNASATGIGSILGTLETNGSAQLINTYGTTDTYSVVANAGVGTLSGITSATSLGLANTDLYGISGYQKTLLDFEDTWVAREGNVPALKAFDDVITEEIVDLSEVKQDQWNHSQFTIYGIGHASALKGFSSIASSYNFNGKTICLLGDVEVNEVNEGTMAAWKAGAGTLPESWTPIGNATTAFSGTFDGQMHTISGVYMKQESSATTNSGGYGLFGQTGWYGMIKNLYLEDSMFMISNQTQSANVGSIVGMNCGKIDTVYSNADVVSHGGAVGGIIGGSCGREVNNCWYDGEIHLTSGFARRAGGIAGYVLVNETFTNMLFTGKISYDNEYYNNVGVGGIIGEGYGYGKAVITLNNVLSAGSVERRVTTAKTGGVGAVIGYLDGFRDGNENPYTSSAVYTNVYGTIDTFLVTENGNQDATVTGEATPLAEAQLYGDIATTNASALDYTNTWVTREGDVPALKIFTKVLGQ